MVFGLVEKGILLANERHHEANMKKIKEISHQNCYLPDFVEKHIKSRNEKLKSCDEENKLVRCHLPSAPYVVLSYQSEMSTKLAKRFKTIYINIVFKTDNKLDYLVKKGKDKLPKGRKQNRILPD